MSSKTVKSVGSSKGSRKVAAAEKQKKPVEEQVAEEMVHAVKHRADHRKVGPVTADNYLSVLRKEVVARRAKKPVLSHHAVQRLMAAATTGRKAAVLVESLGSQNKHMARDLGKLTASYLDKLCTGFQCIGENELKIAHLEEGVGKAKKHKADA